MKYFGDPKFRKEYETQIPTPVDMTCIHCDEPIAEGDTGTLQLEGAMHYECRLRLVVGSVEHQLKLCTCFGGTQDHNHLELTKRGDACAAASLWHATHL